MYLKYGSYQHDPGEANLVSFRIQPRRSARGFQVANIVEANVSGAFCAGFGETQYDIAAKVQALIDATKFDGSDFGLYHDDDTATPHVMFTNDPFSLTGNQIVHRSFPASHNGEFSTGREFAYKVRNEFRASNSLILEYSETISHTGTAGPRVSWREHRYLPAYYVVESLGSVQRIRQEGVARTLATYLSPPPPILPPPFELQHLRTIRRRGPRRYPQGFEAYEVHWSYVFNTPTTFPAFPSVA